MSRDCDHELGLQAYEKGGMGILKVSNYVKCSHAARANEIRWAEEHPKEVAYIQATAELNDRDLIERNHHMFDYCPKCGAYLLTVRSMLAQKAWKDAP